MAHIKRTWSVEEKESILKDIEKTGVVEGCRKHGIYPTTHYFCLEKYKTSDIAGLSSVARKRSDKDDKKLQLENDRLKRLDSGS